MGPRIKWVGMDEGKWDPQHARTWGLIQRLISRNAHGTVGSSPQTRSHLQRREFMQGPRADFIAVAIFEGVLFGD